MKFKIQILTVAAITAFLFSCQESKTNKDIELIENGQSFSFANTQLKETETSSKDTVSEKENSLFGKKPEPFKNEELPKTYTSRKVIRNLGAFTYDIFYLPGNIVRYDEKDSNYVMVTAKSILKNSALPNVQSMQDEILYSNKINNKASFNASALIGGLSVDAEQLMELVIQDVSKSIATDSLIDLEAIKALIKKTPEAKRKDYFFVKSSLLTLVNFRKYSKADFSAKVNTSYVTAEGKIYSSKDKFSKERIVSLDLISFDDILDQVKQQ